MIRVALGIGAATLVVVTSLGAATPRLVTFPGIGAGGVFDPSLEAAGSRVWMSYSAVEAAHSPDCGGGTPAALPRIETHVASSRDRGRTWQEVARVNPVTPACQPDPARSGVWVNEVSTLVRDPRASAATRWKLFWHRYLWTRDTNTQNRRFEHGWIALREARTPAGLATAPERKLFAGAGYDAANDATSGTPEVRLHRLHPDLARCLAFTEPGALATDTALYVALSCRTQEGQRLVLLSHQKHWRYVGTIATGLTAPELFRAGGRTYLLATPESGDRYLGCRGFELDLRSAFLGTRLLTLAGPPGGFSGACGFDPASTASGILLSHVAQGHVFTIVRSGRRLP